MLRQAEIILANFQKIYVTRCDILVIKAQKIAFSKILNRARARVSFRLNELRRLTVGADSLNSQVPSGILTSVFFYFTC